MYKLLVHLLILILLAAGISGCGLLKKQPVDPVSGSGPADPARIAEKGGVPVEFNYLTFSASVNFIAQGNEMALDGEMRIVRDSLIWVSLRKFGLEAARMMLTKDSVWLLDRINSRYFAGDYKYFMQQFKLDADYNLVEALILANPLENWSNEHLFSGCFNNECRILYAGRYRINQGPGMPEGSGITDQVVLYSESTGRLHQNTITIPGQNRSMSATYTGWIRIEGQLFPENTEITLNDGTQVTVLKIKNSGHSLGNIPAFPFKIPAAYKPLM